MTEADEQKMKKLVSQLIRACYTVHVQQKLPSPIKEVFADIMREARFVWEVDSMIPAQTVKDILASASSPDLTDSASRPPKSVDSPPEEEP